MTTLRSATVRNASEKGGRGRVYRLPAVIAVPSLSAGRRGDRRDARIALGIFLLIVGIVGLVAGGHTNSSDEEGYLQTTQAFLRGDYGIPISDANNRVTPTRPGRGGKPVYGGGIGESIAAVPLAVVGAGAQKALGEDDDDYVQRLFAGFTNAWIHALVCVFLFWLCRELGADRRGGTLLALTYGLGTMALPHAKTLFSEPMAALGLTVAMLFAVRAGRTLRARDAALVGVGGLVALLGRVSTAPLVALIAAYLVVCLVRSRRRRAALPALAMVAGLALAGVAVMLGNALRFGSGSDIGYGAVPFGYSPLDGLHGLLLSPGKSLFLYAPIALVALASAVPVARRVPWEAATMWLVVAANVAIFARFPEWHGGQAWGPRYLEITLPLLVALVAPVARIPSWRRVAVVAGIVGVALNWGGSVVYFNYVYWRASQEIPQHVYPDGASHWHAIAFVPEWSPVLRQMAMLPEVARVSAARIDRADPSFDDRGQFPRTVNDRYDWYVTSNQLDMWWYLLFPAGKPKILLLLAPAFLLSAAFGLRRLRGALV